MDVNLYCVYYSLWVQCAAVAGGPLLQVSTDTHFQ